MAQTAHESGGFKHLAENLNYSAKGLQLTWPSRFTPDVAAVYARNPEKIANKVYADRMGNGSEASGDGWHYRGRGLIQTTGKANYQALANHLGLSLQEAVDYCETIKGAVESACFYWMKNNLNDLADRNEITVMTKRINGGTIGLQDRLNKYNKITALLNTRGVANV